MTERLPPPSLSAAETTVIADLSRALTNRIPLEQIPLESWAPIIQTAIRHKLGPLLAWMIEQQGFSIPDSSAYLALQSSAKIADFSYQLLLESQSAVNPALAQAGIPVIWLKGLALAQSVYPQPYLRPMDDLDLLVPYDQRQTALQIIQALGYQAPPQDSLSERMGSPADAPHHYHLLGGPASSIHLELHYRLLVDDRLLPLAELDWFWQESELFNPGAAAFRILKPEAHFIYLAAHAILQHGEADFRLQRYYDLHLLAMRPGFNWDMVISRAQALGWIYALERALTLTVSYFSTPVPEALFTEIQSRRQPEATATRARRLQSTGFRWEGTLLSLEGVPLRERLRRLFWLAFPPADYLRARYAVPPGRPTTRYYFYRWVDASREIFSSLLNRLR